MQIGMSRPDPVSLRLPEGLKSLIEQAAKRDGRSLNAEIRMRLEWSFESGFEGRPSDKMLENEVESLRAELRGSIANITQELEELRGHLSATSHPRGPTGH